jgi:bifunctional non-homologous end joining protein LigD
MTSAVIRPRILPTGFVPPCLPTKAVTPPSGPLWLHEIKHDGFRVVARKNGARIRLYSRQGNDLTWRFPPIVEAVAYLTPRSCIIDGEAVACDDNGVSNFDRLRYRRDDAAVFLHAFDLIELDGEDLRREPLVMRKAALASILREASPGVRLVGHIETEEGAMVFRHACKLGLAPHAGEGEWPNGGHGHGRGPHRRNIRPCNDLIWPTGGPWAWPSCLAADSLSGS